MSASNGNQHQVYDDLDRAILGYIIEHDGECCMNDVAKGVNRAYETIRYRIKTLAEMGHIHLNRTRTHVYCYIIQGQNIGVD